MAILARDNLAPGWWHPESEKDEEVKTEFEITPFNQVDYYYFITQVTPRVSGGQVAVIPNQTGLQFLLEKAVTNWRHFNNAAGEPVEFSAPNKKLIPVEVLKELVDEVVERSSVSAELKKSSE